MKRSITLYLGVLVVTMLAACSSSRTTTPITAYTDPDYLGRTFSRIVVTAETRDMTLRSRIEKNIVEELLERGIAAEESARIFPPTRTWGSSERAAELSRRRIDGVLTISIDSTWISTVHVPEKTTTKVTRDTRAKEETEKKGEGTKKTKEERGREEETITTSTTGGYDYSVTWLQYSARIVDSGSGRVAWIGSAWFTESSDGLESLREDVVGQLEADELLAEG